MSTETPSTDAEHDEARRQQAVVRRRRTRCMEHTLAVLDGTYTPMSLSDGMVVEHHANCSLNTAECDYETCTIIREDSRKNGWWVARFNDGTDSIVHVQDCLPSC